MFRIIRELRERDPVAVHIKYPALPSILSESLVIAAAESIFGPGCSCRYGGTGSDLVLIEAAHLRERSVEVKATARHAFQELKEKDLRADILIWLRFGERFERGGGPVDVGIIEEPGQFIDSPRRLDIRRLRAIPGVAAAERVLSFASVEEMLGRAG